MQNAHGDVTALLNTAGELTKSYVYDAFGVEQNIDDSDSNAFRYCGEYYDAETGTVYLRARYYNPVTGRFISRDSYTGEHSDPLSLNLYTYCANNPIVYVDPSGHWIIKDWYMDHIYEPMENFGGEVFDFVEYCKPNMKNEDGTYSLYDNNRHSHTDNIFHEQILVFDGSLHDVNINKDYWGISRSASVTVMTGGWEYEHVDLSLLDIGRAEASFDLTNKRIGASAMATIWEPEIEFPFWGVNISLTGQVGSVGAEAFLGQKDNGETGFKLGAAGGLGFSVGVSW